MVVVRFVTQMSYVTFCLTACPDVNVRTDTSKESVAAFRPTCATLARPTKSGRHVLAMERAKSQNANWCHGKRTAKFRLGANLAVNVALHWSDIMASALSRRNAALLVLVAILKPGTSVDPT